MNDIHDWLSQNGFLTYGLIGAALGALAMRAETKHELISRFVIGAAMSWGLTPSLSPLIASVLELYLSPSVGEALRSRPAPLVGTIIGLLGFWVLALPLQIARNSLARSKRDEIDLLDLYQRIKQVEQQQRNPPCPYDPIEPLDDDEGNDWPQNLS